MLLLLANTSSSKSTIFHHLGLTNNARPRNRTMTLCERTPRGVQWPNDAFRPDRSSKFQEWTIAQRVTHVILTLRVLILTPSTRVPVARASTEMGMIALVSHIWNNHLTIFICLFFTSIVEHRIHNIHFNESNQRRLTYKTHSLSNPGDNPEHFSYWA